FSPPRIRQSPFRLLPLILTLLILVVALFIFSQHVSSAARANLYGPAKTTPTALPDASLKQQPQEITFDGCPPEGDGDDPVLNQNKNRVDAGNYQPIAFSDILSLTWPKAIERKRHDQWSASAQAEIAQNEGLPVAVEGYLAMAREEGPESTNCHSATDHD